MVECVAGIIAVIAGILAGDVAVFAGNAPGVVEGRGE